MEGDGEDEFHSLNISEELGNKVFPSSIRYTQTMKLSFNISVKELGGIFVAELGAKVSFIA